MMAKSHQSWPIQRRKASSCQGQAAARVICQFIRQRNSHWVSKSSRANRGYILFSRLCACRRVVRSRIPSDPVPRLSWDLSLSLSLSFYTLKVDRLRLRLRRRRRQPSGTSEHFERGDVREELVIEVVRWDSPDHLAFPSLKEPWNWKGSLSTCHRGCPFSPTPEKSRGLEAFSRGSGLHYGIARARAWCSWFSPLRKRFVAYLPAVQSDHF